MTAIKCAYCKEYFERALNHINQSKKRGIKNYCSREHANKAKIGQPGYWLGKKHSIEAKKKMRLAKLSKKNPEHSKRMRGKKPSEETKKKISNAMKGKYLGKNHPNWKGGITPKNIKERNCLKYKQFIKEILKNDNYTCQICSQRGGRLEVDHIMPWSLYPELRYDSDNARILCRPCHIKYGAKPHANKQAMFPYKSELEKTKLGC